MVTLISRKASVIVTGKKNSHTINRHPAHPSRRPLNKNSKIDFLGAPPPPPSCNQTTIIVMPLIVVVSPPPHPPQIYYYYYVNNHFNVSTHNIGVGDTPSNQQCCGAENKTSISSRHPRCSSTTTTGNSATSRRTTASSSSSSSSAATYDAAADKVEEKDTPTHQESDCITTTK